ncbi:MAG: hypothetical protein LBT32_08070 [Peptococcaceae bacterium]|jgi:hypothetical protein|nr:hypothetical protein [Peptococcaceae bacterium]
MRIHWLKDKLESRKIQRKAYPEWNEEEIVRQELRVLARKLERSWDNFMNAAPEFIDIAVLEIYRDELSYGILNRKLQCLHHFCIGQAGKDRLNYLSDIADKFIRRAKVLPKQQDVVNFRKNGES